jgi:hypothetical protein
MPDNVAVGPGGAVPQETEQDAAKRIVSEIHDKFSHDDEYRPVWENRRKVIFGTLILCGSLIAAIILVPLIGSFFPGFTLQEPVSSVLSNGLYVLAFLAATVIGAYVFGANFDSSSYRNSLKEIAKAYAPVKH